MRYQYFLIIVLSLHAFAGHAQGFWIIEWPSLVDAAAQTYEDPYRELSADQFERLMDVVRLRQGLEQSAPGSKEKAGQTAEERALAESLLTDGINVDWLLAQREVVAERRREAAVATNPDLDGAQVEMTGYLMITGENPDASFTGYLMPGRAVCMHLPPPPPNQLVVLSLGRLPTPLGPCIAAAVRGTLHAKEKQLAVKVIDHDLPMWSRWQLNVAEISTAGPLPAVTAADR